MDMPQEGHGPEGADGAEQAFEALRAEVAALRRGVELLYRQAQQAAPSRPEVPDYSPTLGKMEQALGAIAGRLDGVERHPALLLTPAGLRTEIDLVARSAAAAASQPVSEAVGAVAAAARQLEALAGRVHTQREQRSWLWGVGVTGAVAGVFLWFMLAMMLPWGGGTWLAALPLGGKWQGGVTLLQEAAPAMWDRMVRLDRACPQDSTTDLCEAAMVIRTMPALPALTGAEGPKTAPLARPATPLAGKGGQGR